MATSMGSSLASGNDVAQVARQAARQAMLRIGDDVPRLAVVFASSTLDLECVVREVGDELDGVPLIGCSSSGEFTHDDRANGGVAVTVIASDRMEVTVGVGENFAADVAGAVRAATADFAATRGDALRPGWRGRTLFLFVDGLAGRAEEVITALISHTGMQYQLFGGAAADDLKFHRTFVFHNRRVLTGAFVCAEILSEKPFSIAFSHGWVPAGPVLRVTAAEGAVLRELNGMPAWDAYLEFAAEQGLPAPAAGAEAPFLMRHILGMQVPGGHKLRVPLFKNADGSLGCAAEVPEGALVQIMQSNDLAILAGGESAVRRAAGADGPPLAGALVVECVATRLHLGERFSDQVGTTARSVDPAHMIGCASFGQLARVDAEFSGLMDATSLVCLIPS